MSTHLPDFEETNAALDETVRGLMAYNPHKSHTPEILSFMQGTIHEQNLEIRELRAELSKVVTTSNTKASKEELANLGNTVSDSLNKRLDSIRNWAAIAISAIGICFAVASYVGHK